MLGGLGALVLGGLLPERWSWNVTLLAAATPVLVALAATLALARYFPARLGAEASAPGSAGAASAIPPARPSVPPIVRLMVALGVVMALAWSAGRQVVTPLPGAREIRRGR